MACGPEFPNSLLDGGEGASTGAPVLDYSRELARMKLAEKKFTARPGTNGYAAQTEVEAEPAEGFANRARKDGVGGQGARAEFWTITRKQRESLQNYVEAVKHWDESGGSEWRDGEWKPLKKPLAGALDVIQVAPGLPREFADYFRGSIAFYRGRYE